MIIYELFNVVKSAGIYEQNKAGKTCLIKCIKAIRDIILTRHNYLVQYIFLINIPMS